MFNFLIFKNSWWYTQKEASKIKLTKVIPILGIIEDRKFVKLAAVVIFSTCGVEILNIKRVITILNIPSVKPINLPGSISTFSSNANKAFWYIDKFLFFLLYFLIAPLITFSAALFAVFLLILLLSENSFILFNFLLVFSSVSSKKSLVSFILLNVFSSQVSSISFIWLSISFFKFCNSSYLAKTSSCLSSDILFISSSIISPFN